MVLNKLMERALFLDRDGVINVEKDYLHKIEDFEFIDGIFKVCKYYQDLGYKIFVVTNQSGIARGYYSEDDFKLVTNWMINEFKVLGIYITNVYYCPHHPDITGDCECRKPMPGMLLQASKDFDIDLNSSIIIGDKERDIEAGINAGINTAYLFDPLKNTSNTKATKVINKLEDAIC